MGVAVSGDGRRVYVSNGRGNSVLVIDARTYKILTTIPVEGRPWGIAISPDNKKVYTANGLSDDIYVIDTKTDKVIKTIKLCPCLFNLSRCQTYLCFRVF